MLVFLSTLSLRRATDERCKLRRDNRFLSTLSLRRATGWQTRTLPHCWHFYPRSPCGERPFFPAPRPTSINNFYPRSPCGERPNSYSPPYTSSTISIHALLAESDWSGAIVSTSQKLFLSTLSLRRATCRSWAHWAGLGFLSTLSLRRATLD